MENWQFPATAHEVALSSPFRHVTGFFTWLQSPPHRYQQEGILLQYHF